MTEMGGRAVVFWVVLVSCASSCGGTSFKFRDKLTKLIGSDNVMDVSDFSVYYDTKTNETIRKMMPRPWYKPGWMLRLPFTGGPCTCEGLHCKCCTGIRIPAFDFDRQTCALLTLDPEMYMIDLEVKMNNDSIYKNTFSARNPPPFCIPITLPYLPPGLVDMCIRLFDITVMDQKLHACLDIDTRVAKAPVLVLHFDCMDMGFSGVSLSKPGDSVTPTTEIETSDSKPESSQLNSDIFDIVTEPSTAITTQTLFNITAKYI